MQKVLQSLYSHKQSKIIGMSKNIININHLVKLVKKNPESGSRFRLLPKATHFVHVHTQNFIKFHTKLSEQSSRWATNAKIRHR